MATAKKAAKPSTALAKSAPKGQSLATIDQEMANEVANLKEQIGQASGNKIKVEASGDIILPDGGNLGNEIQLVVVDFVSRNNWYFGPFVPGQPSPPDCYAIGKVINTMAPEPDSPAIQSDKCSSCELNQFGSGANGKSKACKNSRLVAVLVIDPENPEAHNDPAAPLYTIDLPPTAIQSFDGAVAAVARSLAGPPVKAILTMTATNAGTYALIKFVEPVPNPDYAVHFARRAETVDMLNRKPDFSAPVSKPRGRAPARRATPARR